MVISGIQKLTVLDYPEKVACILFTRDCNFRCPFCHNATLVLPSPDCEQYSEEEILSFLNKRKKLLDGVCITGGEPLIHNDIYDFIKKIKDMGYSVKLDTNGAFPDMLENLVTNGLVDYVAMDIKNSLALYEKTVGRHVDTDKILQSIRFLLGGIVEYEFRTTVVRELHTPESLRDASALIKGAKKYYLQTFVNSGNLVDDRNFSAYTDEQMKELLEIVRENVPNASLRSAQ